MMLEDEVNAICDGDYELYEIEAQITEEQRVANVRETINREKDHVLRADLADHIWRIWFPNNEDN